MTEENRLNLQGVIVPLLTPLTEDGELDGDSLRRLVRRCTDAGVAALFAGGSAGAGPMLLDDQWEEMVSTVLDAADGKAPVMAGIIATSTARALEQIKISHRLGCDTIVVTPTFYIALQREAEILAHFRACREATDQNLVIYNIPSCTGCHIPVSTVRQMCEADWAVAIKESSGDSAYFRELLTVSKETGVQLLQGNETDICWSLADGAAGIVPVCANYDPAMFVEAYGAVKNGGANSEADHSGLQERLNALRETLLIGEHNWIAGISWGLHTQGIGSGIPPLPLQPVGQDRKDLIAALKEPKATTAA